MAMGVPIKSLVKETADARLVPVKELHVVSECIRCGAPIYGPVSIPAGEQVQAVFTCSCRLSRQEFSDTIQTK